MYIFFTFRSKLQVHLNSVGGIFNALLFNLLENIWVTFSPFIDDGAPCEHYLTVDLI